MSLNIKSPEAERLARELARATGESLTGAVTTALRERLVRVQGQDGTAVAERAARIAQIAGDAAGRWTEQLQRSDHADLLYDERGLPR